MENALFQLLFYWGVIVVVALVVVIIALMVYVRGMSKMYFEAIQDKEKERERHTREIRQIRDEEKGFPERK